MAEQAPVIPWAYGETWWLVADGLRGLGNLTVGLIADGVHLDPLVLRIVAGAARDRISLVSDAVATGLGGQGLTHGPSGARLPDGTLAGGTAGLDRIDPLRVNADAGHAARHGLARSPSSRAARRNG